MSKPTLHRSSMVAGLALSLTLACASDGGSDVMTPPGGSGGSNAGSSGNRGGGGGSGGGNNGGSAGNSGGGGMATAGSGSGGSSNPGTDAGNVIDPGPTPDAAPPSNMPGSCGSTGNYAGPLLGRCSPMACTDGKCGTVVGKGGFLTFDDFEGLAKAVTTLPEADPNANIGINWPSRDGRTGAWLLSFPAADMGTNKIEVATTDMNGGSPNSRQALHYTAKPSSSWGASFYVPMGSNCYDAGAYEGMSLWLKGDPNAGNTQVKINLHTPPTQPAEFGGACTAGCYDHFSVLLDIKPGWTKYSMKWSDFKRQSCTAATPPVPESFEPQKQILSISFGQIDPMKGVDLWIDDITFDLNPESRDSFEKIVTKPTFDALVRGLAPVAPYSHEGLVAAVGKYGSRWAMPLAGHGSPTQRKHEAAAFMAQIQHETGSFQYAEETAESRAMRTDLGQYYGRGAIQLSLEANYRAAEAAGFSGIVANPSRVSQDADYAFGTAIWFWTTPQSAVGVCQAAIDQGNFAGTTRIINGIECSASPLLIAKQEGRRDLYWEWAAAMGINGYRANLICQ